MKRKHVLRIVAVLIICCLLGGCSKEGKETVVYGTIFYRGNPIEGKEVSLTVSGYTPICSTVTGSDGQYEFRFIYDKSQNYSIHIGSQSYPLEYHSIEIREGEMNKYDFNLGY